MTVNANGLDVFRSDDLDESEDAVKITKGKVYGWSIYNAHASAVRYFQLYDALVVTVGTTTPVLTVGVPPGETVTESLPGGIGFDTAITAAATTGPSDAGAPGANEVIANVLYQ